MKFNVGQDVYVGYCPDSRIRGKASRLRCSVATIIDGPFLPDKPIRGYPYTCPHRAWEIQPETGKPGIVAEYLLSPFRDPGDVVDLSAILDAEMTE